MDRVVIMFTKTGYIRYCSHLDLMRIFKRSFRRAGIIVMYSEGFNPHPRMDIASPLPLGVEGNKELLDFLVEDAGDPVGMMDKLRKSLPNGIDLLKIGLAEAGQRSVASAVRFSIYRLSFSDDDFDTAFDAARAIIDSDSVVVEKRTKKGMRKTEIRDRIVSIYKAVDDEHALICKLCTGSSCDLGVNTFKKALAAVSKETIDYEKTSIERTDVILDVDYKISWL